MKRGNVCNNGSNDMCRADTITRGTSTPKHVPAALGAGISQCVVISVEMSNAEGLVHFSSSVKMIETALNESRLRFGKVGRSSRDQCLAKSVSPTI